MVLRSTFFHFTFIPGEKFPANKQKQQRSKAGQPNAD